MPNQASERRAVVLFSGGLDSTTLLASVTRDGFCVYALTARYGQVHGAEVDAAARIARDYAVCDHVLLDVDLGVFGGSSLTTHPPGTTSLIPATYVPARNTVLLALALSWAEALGARDVFIGANAVDYSGYPDCRPGFIEAFQRVADAGTRDGVEGRSISVNAPLIAMTKSEIVSLGRELGVDYSRTRTCYRLDGAGFACGVCDACRIRLAAFGSLGIRDPAPYRRRGSCPTATQ